MSLGTGDGGLGPAIPAQAAAPGPADVSGRPRSDGRRRPGQSRDERRRPPGRTRRKIIRGAGELLITLGVVVALFAVYEVYGKTPAINAHQARLVRELDRMWTQPSPGTSVVPPPPTASAPGGAIARMYIPAMKLNWVVVEGVTLADIRYAPGHYPGTALPGQVGNFAVAGHRIPPLFWNLQEVRPGDQIVVETRTNWYVYLVTVNEIVSPHAIEVIAPTPDRPGVPARYPSLTLTTCNPKWDDFQRMVVHAVLTTTVPRSAGPPIPLGS